MRADVSILLALKAAEQKYSQKMAEKGGLKAVVHSCIHALFRSLYGATAGITTMITYGGHFLKIGFLPRTSKIKAGLFSAKAFLTII